MSLIEKEALMKELAKGYVGSCAGEATLEQLVNDATISDAIITVEEQPTVDAIPVEWIRKYTEENRLYQSDDFDFYIIDMIADWEERKE